MEYILTQVPGWIVTAVIGLIGIGIGWGFVRSEVSHLTEGQKKQEIKIETLESRKLSSGFKDDCESFRGKCQSDMKDKFEEIKSAINKNRETVVEQFNEIREFVGYVKGKIEDYNGRLK